MTEIPRHLLETTQRRHEMDNQAEIESMPLSGLESRLNGVVDMASEPCSLLAEHVAAKTSQMVSDVAPRVEYPRLNVYCKKYEHGGLAITNHVSDLAEVVVHDSPVLYVPDDAPHTTSQYFIPLADECGDSRIVSVGIAGRLEWTVEPTTPKRRFRRTPDPVERYRMASTERADIAAFTNRRTIIPLFGVSLNRSKLDCSFVTRIPDNSMDVDEIIMSRQDIDDEPAGKLALEAMLKMLRDREHFGKQLIEERARIKMVYLTNGEPEMTLDEFTQRNASIQKPTVDISQFGVSDKLEKLLGKTDASTESVLKMLMQNIEAGAEAQKTRKLARKVVIGGINYDGIASIIMEKEGACRYTIDTALELPGAPSFGAVPIFPRLRVYTASNVPLRFDGFDPEENDHLQMVIELAELISAIK